MSRRLRDVAVTVVSAVCLAGAGGGVILPLVSASWRKPALAWAILIAALALTARCRHRRRPSP
jgi:hypothetical protein